MRARHALLALALLSAVAHAEICPKLEFVELDSMSSDELLNLRCQYVADMGAVLSSPRSRDNASLALRVVDHCVEQQMRMDRILGRRYAIQASPEELAAQIGRRCPKK